MSLLLKSFIGFTAVCLAALALNTALKDNPRAVKYFKKINFILFTFWAAFLAAVAGQALFKGIEFETPWVFLLLILIPAFISVKAFFNNAFEPAINFNLRFPGRRSIKKLLAAYASYTFILLAVICIIIALARPRKLDTAVLPPNSGIDIIITLDTSGSMTARDFRPTRMEAAKKAAALFIQNRPHDRIGLVVFAGTAMLSAPLTSDHESLLDFLSAVYAGMLNVDLTAVGDALAVSAAHIEKSEAKSKIIILLTDGASNAGAIDPRLAAQTVRDMGIKVYTIATVGGADAHDFDEGLLRETAAMTGGAFYHAANENELNNIYRTIDSLEKTEFKQNNIITYQDKYYPFLALAAIFLLLAFITSKFIFIKVP